MTTTVTITVPPELEGALAQVRASLKTNDSALASDALIFALRRVIEGMPMDGSLVSALEANNAVRAAVRERILKLLLTAEKALADASALHETLTAIGGDIARAGGSVR